MTTATLSKLAQWVNQGCLSASSQLDVEDAISQIQSIEVRPRDWTDG